MHRFVKDSANDIKLWDHPIVVAIAVAIVTATIAIIVVHHGACGSPALLDNFRIVAKEGGESLGGGINFAFVHGGARVCGFADCVFDGGSINVGLAAAAVAVAAALLGFPGQRYKGFDRLGRNAGIQVQIDRSAFGEGANESLGIVTVITMNQWKEGKEEMEMETETHSVVLLSWPVDLELSSKYQWK